MSARRVANPALAVAVAMVAACHPLDESQQGSLGKGVFSYDCVSDEDAYCPGAFGQRPFPPQITLGGRFEISFEPNDSSTQTGAILLEPVSPAMLASAGDTFEAQKAGRAGILAVTANDAVIDTTDVVVVAPVQLRLTGDDGQPLAATITLTVGGSISIHATALGDLDSVLAGVLVCTATSSATSVVTAPAPATASPLALSAVATGTASVTLTCGGATVTLQLKVT